MLPKSLEKLEAIVDVPFPTDEYGNNKIKGNEMLIDLQRKAAKDVIDAGFKLRDEVFKVKQADSLDKILAMLEERKKEIYGIENLHTVIHHE